MLFLSIVCPRESERREPLVTSCRQERVSAFFPHEDFTDKNLQMNGKRTSEARPVSVPPARSGNRGSIPVFHAEENAEDSHGARKRTRDFPFVKAASPAGKGASVRRGEPHGLRDSRIFQVRKATMSKRFGNFAPTAQASDETGRQRDKGKRRGPSFEDYLRSRHKVSAGLHDGMREVFL